MKSMKTLGLAIISAAFLISCGGETKEESTETTESSEAVKETCTYSYVSDSTTLKWTAYKFTKRAGVSGTFDSYMANNLLPSNNPMNVLIGADFSIDATSVNSGNAERDPKLVEYFFKKLAEENHRINAKIISINNGEAVVTIYMNNKTVDVIGKVIMDGNRVSLTTSIDMADFEGLGAIASLNEVCSAKHTDEDGESILWPDVDIVVSTVLKKECK